MNRKHLTTVLAIAAIVIAIIATKRCMDKKVVIKQAAELITPDADTATHWQDDNGQQHAKEVAHIVSLEAALTAKDKEIQRLADKLHLRTAQIKDMLEVMARDSGHVTVRVDTFIDSSRKDVAGNPIKVQRFGYKDTWAEIDGQISEGIADIDYSVSVPINVTTYWKRRWFLGRKTYYVDGTSSNPNVSITGINKVMIKDRMPGRFGIGPYVGIDISGRPSFGLAFTWAVVRF